MILEQNIKMKAQKKIILANKEDTGILAKKISKIITKKFFICLNGDLGSGKTTFASYLINSLSPKKIKVLSPTFPMVNQYFFGKFKIWHYDLYRLKKPDEIFSLDYDDALKDFIIMEWSKKIKDFLPRDRLELFFDEDSKFNRFLRIEAYGKIKFKIKKLCL